MVFYMTESMRINDLPAGERPRERLLALGAEALTDVELLAILLHTGTTGMGVVQMAESIIARFGSLGKLMTAPARALNDIKGLGPAKRSQMLAVLELGRRCYAGEIKTQPIFQTPKSLHHFLHMQFAGQKSESFIALFLDVDHRMIACETLFKGTLTRTAVYPREIVRRALDHNAAAVIFAHNHPTGEAKPSAMDKKLTSELKKVMDCIEIPMLDHLIVSGSNVWSFRAHGWC